MTNSLFLFILAILFALIEIEAEGKFGWAEKMPTWYRKTGLAAKIYGMCMGGKPLTGYHAYMFLLPLLVFHLPFFMGLEFSLAKEFQILAVYFAWAVYWDALWFILNPEYGLKRFRRENIWWHAKSHWIVGRLPIDYAVGVIVSLLIAFSGEMLTGEALFLPHVWFLVHFQVLTFVVILLAPFYHRWRRKMGEKDERHLANIFHQ